MKSFIRPFDLEKAQLLRAALVRRQEGYLLMLDMHHIVSDGMSAGIFFREFAAIYNGEGLTTAARQYKDYSEWMRSRDLTAQKDYWVSLFRDEIPVLDLPLDFHRPQEQSFKGGEVYRSTGRELGDRIRAAAKKAGATEYMVLLSAAMVLLGKYSRQEDIVIGSPVSGRTHKDTEGMLGMFVNTLAMRGKPEGGRTYADFLKEIRESCLKAYENQEYPFEELVEAVEVRRDISRNPLFDVMLVFQNNERGEIRLNGADTRMTLQEHTIAKFDLTFNIWEKEGEYLIALEYCSDLFREESVQRMLDHYHAVLEQVTVQEEILLRDIETATAEEKVLILGAFNDTAAEYPREKTVVQLLEEQVERTPDSIAVVYEEEQLTYAQLNSKANQLAYRLRKLGVGPDDFVVLLAERSIEMIMGICGIIKSGGAYVPIDPGYPKDRIEYMLSDCKPKAVITYNAETDTGYPVIDLAESKAWEGVSQNPIHVNKPHDLLYVIYTSGTTGKPKGAMIEHRNVVRLLCNEKYQFKITYEDTWTMFHSYCFDFSVWEMYGALLYGCRLIIVSGSISKDPVRYLELLRKHKVTILNQTPTSFYQLLTEELNCMDKELALRYIIFGGEALRPSMLKPWVDRYPLTKIINMYGITETTVHVTFKEITSHEMESDISNIGSPIPTLKVYILDSERKLLPMGIPGELFVAGDGVGRGYLNLPELTAEKFIDNPFGDSRLYRSGDLARWLPDGEIEYLGRIDEQVKIRGFRIELGEIENVIRKIPCVRDTAVTAGEGQSGEKAIHAYIVSDKEININDIREALSKDLPEYMIPAFMMQIDRIPVTRNGKLDKRSLPKIEVRSQREYAAPDNESEEVVCGVFSEILKVEKVSIYDNFFELGGDSIKAIRAVSKIREAGYKVTVKDIMSQKTVVLIARKVKRSAEEYAQEAIEGEVLLTPVMEWMEKLELKKPEHFNQAIMLKTAKFHQAALHEAMQALVKHHDMLRAVYDKGSLRIRRIEAVPLYDYEEHSLMAVSEREARERIGKMCSKIQSEIDLANGPLVKTALFKMEKEEHLMIAIHHLVVDGVSWRILLEDLKNAYEQRVAGRTVSLPQKTASFMEWSRLLKEYGESDGLKKELDYWNDIRKLSAAGNIPPQKEGEYQLHYKEVGLNGEKTSVLIYEAGKAYTTEINDLLLSGLALAVKELTGQDKLSIQLEGHGREKIHRDIAIDRTVGWFTTIYPVIVKAGKDIRDTIIMTKEMLRKVPDHGIGYGILSCLTGVYKPEALSVGFNYLGELGEAVKRVNEIEISDYSTGASIATENQLEPPIAFNGSVRNGALVFGVSYDTGRYAEDFISRLGHAFINALEDIINHCMGLEEQVKTASDYGLEDWNTDEFEKLLDIVHTLDQ